MQPGRASEVENAGADALWGHHQSEGARIPWINKCSRPPFFGGTSMWYVLKDHPGSLLEWSPLALSSNLMNIVPFMGVPHPCVTLSIPFL